ncbi:insecticidal toxin [Xenorhabdus koppenhoeferi]|uniref:Insecticidal toxin n=1 Tax=Xenorhabdus koppenhoeferi TaxID=351659 RepID=A0A1I7HCL4_9GAMM|nr:TcdA/TcdB pore-forming domain-containing protein [Xenorhabdus koppenhoeferi]SFU58484.1 insecticidal toxin [Xenorhabdus koppenhoeferi]
MPNNSAHINVGERYAFFAKVYQYRARPEFTDGLRNFQDVSIPGFNDRMSALEMKSLFLEGQLTEQQQGALISRITEASRAEYIDQVLKQTAVFSADFQRAGSISSHLVPQDFYLSLVRDASGGRCYPLVRAMAVALASNGEAGINSLVEKLFLAAASPQAGSSTLLKNSLVNLHSNGEAGQASTPRGRATLSEVVSLLKKSAATSMFALNTLNHSMMVGSTVGAAGRRYYFYDPNVGVFAFDNAEYFSSAMVKHLVKRNLAVYYSAFGSQSTPTFNLVEIDPVKMAKAQVGYGLNVADLTRPDALTTVIEQRKPVKQIINAYEKIAEDANLHTALVTLDTKLWGARFDKAITKLARKNKLDKSWMPVIDNILEQDKGHYGVQFINRDTLEEKWISSKDDTFVKFRHFIDKHMHTRNQHFTLGRGQKRHNFIAGEAASVDGLNAGFAVQSLIHWFANKNRNYAALGISSPDLATALKIHSYLNYTQIAHSGVNDVLTVTKLVRIALGGNKVNAKTSLKVFSSAMPYKANKGIGLLFGLASIGLDAYELAHAETDTQKAVFGTQLAFDSASIVSGAAGIGVGLLGASTAAAVLSSTGVIMGGLAVGFTALVQAFSVVAEDAKAVGVYFNMLDKAYKGNGYRYDSEKDVLVPLTGAVIKTLDLRNKQVDLDSQYIYRTSSGATGSGEINYFFWIADFPKMVRDRSQALEVRSGIGYKTASHYLNHSDSNVLILPGTPKSFIRYQYMQLPGATMRNDTGFDVLRRLEENYRFDYDFYIFPGEVTIRRIYQEYVKTQIEVRLDQRSRKLIVPELPKALYGYLHYEIKGAGGDYLIGLNEGTTVKLMSDVANSDGSGNLLSRWVIDSSSLDNGTINFPKNPPKSGEMVVKIGGIEITLDPSQNGQVLLVNRKNEVREIDFFERTANVVKVDASEVSDQQIEKYLRDLAKADQLHGQYVVVENYSYNERNVGRAFYEVAKERMIFTDTPHEQAKHAQLGAVMGGHAYFYDADNATAWRVDIATGQVDVQFMPWGNHNAGKISRLWQEGDVVYLTHHYQLKGRDAELGYRIIDNRMELVSVVCDDALLQHLASTDRQDDVLGAILQSCENSGTQRKMSTYTLGARQIQPTRAELITVFGMDTAGVAHRYWIRTNDGTLIKPNLAPSFNHTLYSKAHEQTHHAWQMPTDLVLAGSIFAFSGKEVFFFYSKEQKVLFRQEGPGQAVIHASSPTALRVSTPPLANIVKLNGSLFAITEDGRVAQLSALGQLRYVAVNEHWLKGRTHWWQDLACITDSGNTLAVFGVKGSDGKRPLSVWYHNGQVVVPSAALQDKSLQFLGFETGGTSAQLFEPESGKLYLQPAISANALAAAFGSDHVLDASAQLPVASELTPELSLKEVQLVDVGMRLITTKGEILLRSNNGKLQLVGVNKEWQQNNVTNLPQALAKLANQWHFKGVLTLQSSHMLRWFDVGSGQLFVGNGIPASDHLSFVGTNAKNRMAYVYNQTTQELYCLNNKGDKITNKINWIKRINSSLLLQGGEDNDTLTPPIIDGVDSLVLYGGANNDTYQLSKEMWDHYRTVVIDNYDPEQAFDLLKLPIANPGSILLSRHNDDLKLTDTGNGTELVVRQVYKSKAKTNLHIYLDGASSLISVVHLVNSLSKQKETNSMRMDCNLLVNGDFEQGAEGWMDTNGIEAKHAANAYGLSTEGHGECVTELDVTGNTNIYQDIKNLTADEKIFVNFDFARRVNTGADNGLEVYWNDQLVFNAVNSSPGWQHRTLNLTARAGSNRLEFSGIGLSDGFGYVLDNVVATNDLDEYIAPSVSGADSLVQAMSGFTPNMGFSDYNTNLFPHAQSALAMPHYNGNIDFK